MDPDELLCKCYRGHLSSVRGILNLARQRGTSCGALWEDSVDPLRARHCAEGDDTGVMSREWRFESKVFGRGTD